MKLTADQRELIKASQILTDLLSNSSAIPPKYQKLVAELILLRLFGLLEMTIRAVVVKVLCGAQYSDGSVPMLLVRSTNMTSAEYNMRVLGRRKRKRDLKWTMGSEIIDNVRHLIDPADPLFMVISSYDLLLNEMRVVRNHVAHANADTRGKYKPIVAKYYGAYVPSVAPGTLLLSDRFSPRLILQYISTSRIMIKDLIRA